MSRATSDGAASRKLIDALDAGRDLGPATAVLATTFDLNPDFFDTDFLPSILGIPAAEDRQWRTRVQLEAELARLNSVSVLTEATRWNGRPRTLRVHVQPARAHDRGVLHAKIVLIVHEAAVRLIVGSANLTKAGYRENREVATVLVASRKTRENGALVRQALTGIESRLGHWWNGSADVVVSAARAVLDELGAPAVLDDEWFIWGGDEQPLFRQVLQAWPEAEPVRRIRIVSPFWSEETGHGPLARLLGGLAERDAATADAEVLLVTSARPDGTQTWRPALPETYATFDFATLGVRASAIPSKILVDADDVGRDDIVTRRELHAKVLLLEGPKTTLAYVGSANFTVPGWGFGTLQGSNLEAGILLRRQGRARTALEVLIPPVEGKPVNLEGDARPIVTVLAEIESHGEWPHFLRGVELRPEVANMDRLELVVSNHPELTPATWSVAISPETPPREATLSPASRFEHRISLDADDVRALIDLQAVQVRWLGGPVAGISYPVNVSLAARERIPFGDVRLLPSEDDLVAFYQGRIAFEDLFPPPPGEVEGEAHPATPAIESVVDTSKILSYQVRAFIEALTGLGDELGRNTATERSMRLAILGPVSPVALAREIERAAKLGRSPVAAGFQLAELLAVLRTARRFPVDAKLASVWSLVLEEGEIEVAKRLTQLREAHPALAEDTAFGTYVRATAAAEQEDA